MSGSRQRHHGRGRRAGTLACLCAVLLGCGGRGERPATEGAPQRIISLAPSITETLFAVGCGDRVVAVTDFCAYPPEVQSLPRVGAYIDPNFEHILSLKPQLVVLMKEHTAVADFLKASAIPYLTIDNHDLESMLGSLKHIGRACGNPTQADSLVESLRSRLTPADTAAARPSVLLCVGRSDIGSGAIAQVFVAGKSTFYDELLHVAGGRNAVSEGAAAYPSLSLEGIVRLNPDIIVDVMASMGGVTEEQVRADWKSLGTVKAVSNGMVFCVSGSFMTIPGPRVVLILEELQRVVHAFRSAHKEQG